MPRDNLSIDHRAELARKFRAAANRLDEGGRLESITLQDVKNYLLAALYDCDRAMSYGRPGAGIDQLLGVNDD